jgi:hypothetical protein
MGIATGPVAFLVGEAAAAAAAAAALDAGSLPGSRASSAPADLARQPGMERLGALMGMCLWAAPGAGPGQQGLGTAAAAGRPGSSGVSVKAEPCSSSAGGPGRLRGQRLGYKGCGAGRGVLATAPTAG